MKLAACCRYETSLGTGSPALTDGVPVTTSSLLKNHRPLGFSEPELSPEAISAAKPDRWPLYFGFLLRPLYLNKMGATSESDHFFNRPGFSESPSARACCWLSRRSNLRVPCFPGDRFWSWKSKWKKLPGKKRSNEKKAMIHEKEYIRPRGIRQRSFACRAHQ